VNMSLIAHLFILFRERDRPLGILTVYNEWMWIVRFLPLSIFLFLWTVLIM